MKLGGFIKAQLFGKQEFIVSGRNRVAHRQAGYRLPQPAAAHADVVSLIQRVEELRQLFRRVLVI